MLEIEAKARIEDPEGLRRTVMEKGGVLQGTKFQRDVYYAHPSRDFASTDEALRIRESAGTYVLTYKGPKLDAATKTREEFEVGLQGADEAREILSRLGFKKVGEVEKDRESYILSDYRVMLDTVEGLGTFVEVEKKADTYDPDELVAFLRDLGMSPDRMERRSYLELLLEKE